MFQIFMNIYYLYDTSANTNLELLISEISYHILFGLGLGVRVMVFNVTFNNISAILWASVLFVEVTRVSGENHRPVTRSLAM